MRCSLPPRAEDARLAESYDVGRRSSLTGRLLTFGGAFHAHRHPLIHYAPDFPQSIPPPASLSALHILSCDTAIFSLSKHSVFSSHGILEDFYRIIYEGFIDIKKRILLFTIKIVTNVKVYFERVSKCLKKKGNE